MIIQPFRGSHHYHASSGSYTLSSNLTLPPERAGSTGGQTLLIAINYNAHQWHPLDHDDVPIAAVQMSRAAASSKPAGARPLLQPLQLALAAVASTLLAVHPVLAGEDLEAAAQVFSNSCAGCHAEGGNVMRHDARLVLDDLEKNGISSSEGLYDVIYSGRRSMPGFGQECTPNLQCTFGPRLGDDAIRSLAQFVWQRANQGWK